MATPTASASFSRRRKTPPLPNHGTYIPPFILLPSPIPFSFLLPFIQYQGALQDLSMSGMTTVPRLSTSPLAKVAATLSTFCSKTAPLSPPLPLHTGICSVPFLYFSFPHLSLSAFTTFLPAFSFPGSTPLHLAARGGHLDCVRDLLAWGADRLHTDSAGYQFTLLLFHTLSSILLAT